MTRSLPFVLLFAVLALAGVARAQVVINEIHYHPVEIATFDSAGNPIFSGTGLPADLTDDVHEFIEIYNAGASAVDLSGWKFSTGVDFTFPPGESIAAGGYRVIAKNPARIQTVYAVTGVLGPFANGSKLSNGGDSIRLQNGSGTVIDEVSYSSSFPWPTTADALGAGDDFTLLTSSNYQYKGRSLQRVSAAANSSDPANWLASPLSPGPTPGSANAVTLAVPKPVVVAINVIQASNESAIIRATEPARVTCTFSSTVSLTGVVVEYFVDDVNVFETSASYGTVAMTALANGQYTATLPGQADRKVVRYRIKADRGTGVEQVSPRGDDVAIVPMSMTLREAWHAYFVTPVRTSTATAVYDILVSTDGATVSDTLGANNYPFNGLNGLQAMAYNATGNPKRTTAAGFSGLPRDTPFVLPSDRQWNGSVPAIFVENGNVRDVHFRYHGSRYNRHPSRPTYKLRFSDTQKFQEADSVFITDKTDYFSVMHGLYVNANLPISTVRWIDWYMNGNAKVTKIEQGEYNGDLLRQFHERQANLNPGTAKEKSGEFYKDVGVLSGNEEGPYGLGDERPLPAAGSWTSIQRYEWTYLLQNSGWKGAKPIRDFLEGMWTARGDTFSAPNPNIASLRAYLDTVMDVDTELTSMAILNWGCPWDDTSQNHFLWKRANGKWAHFPWDFDAFFGNGDTTGTNSWIYLGEVGSPSPATNAYGTIFGNNSRGPNFFKDSILKAYRTEYNARLWILNNTYLHPDTLKTLYFTTGSGTQQSYYTYINSVKAGFCEARFASVNTQLGHAADGSDFLRPNKPVNAAPTVGATALPPASLVASDYTHTSGNPTGANAHARSKWEIRGSAGDYLTPVVVTSSTTSLTSLAIPFDQLTFGGTYFWRVTYYDGNDRPSLTSAETSFVFGPQPSTQTLINFSDTWKYNHSLTFSDNSWTQSAYVDTAWLSGPATLAFEDQASSPETIRTTLPDPRTLSPSGRAYYFRKKFTFPGNPLTATVRIRHLIDDGCVIWINGVKIHRYYMNEAATYATSLLSNSGPGDAIYQYADAITGTGTWAYIDPRPYMVEGENVIAVEVHQVATSSSDITFALQFTATLPSTPGDVVINEVMANNVNVVANGGKYPDWIELKNATNAAINIGGNGLTDDILVPTRYVFPANTIIPAGGYLVVWCDKDTTAPGLHTGFGLDNGGQRVVLTNGGAIRDFVTFGPQAANYTIGRMADGIGGFALTVPTPNATNSAVATLGATANLRINEWMANPVRGEDWFEIYNADANPVAVAGLWLSDTPGTPKITAIPPLSFIAGKGFADFIADGTTAGGNHCNFRLATAGESLVLTSGNTTLDSVTFGVQIKEVSQGRLPDGGATVVSFPLSSSISESNWLPAPAVINEALTVSPAPFEDAIEIYNPTASAVSIGSWWLSDSKGVLQKFQIPSGTTIPAGGYKVFYENQFNPTPGVGNSFALKAAGDEIYLSAVDGAGALTGYRSQVKFGAAASGVPFGRVATGSPPESQSPEFWPLTARTFGQDNPLNVADFRTGTGAINEAPKIGPLTINELMYHPVDFPGAVDNARDEFIELHNVTTSSQSIAGWRLKGASDFTFAGGAAIRPGDYVLVVSFDPSTDPTSLSAFRSLYGLTAATPIYGPYTPKLSNSTQSVELAYPGSPISGVVPFILVDKVVYSDSAPWPVSPDGFGSSLQRISRAVIGNDLANWSGDLPTPGAVNSGQTPILDSDGDGMPDAWETANGLDRFNAADAALDSDSDGRTNLEEYLAGTDPQNAASYLSATVTHPPGGGYVISFLARAGRSYTIQWRSELGTGTWQKLTDIAAPGSDTPVTHTDPTADPRRFYRVVTPSTP